MHVLLHSPALAGGGEPVGGGESVGGGEGGAVDGGEGGAFTGEGGEEAAGGGGWKARDPQSTQSVPSVQYVYSAPWPPSSQSPSLA